MNQSNSIIEKLSGLFAFLVVYSYSLSFVIDILFSSTTHILSYFTAACGAIIILFVILDLIRCHFVVRRYEFGIGCIAFLLIVSSIITRTSYAEAAAEYIGAFNSLLVRGIPALLAGLLLAKNRCIQKIETYIIPIIIIATLTLAVTVSRNDSGDVMLFTTLGIDRQTLSYLASFMICWSAYCIIHFDELETVALFKLKLWRIILVICAMVNLWPLFAGGGRGALVEVAVFAVYLLFLHIKPMRTIKGFLTLILGIIVIIALWQFLEKTEAISSGTLRIISLFSGTLDQSSLERLDIYTNSIALFNEHPILGGGVGSSICRLGIWSHNVFLDVIADFGIIGLVLFCFVVIRSLKTVICNVQHDRTAEIVFIMGFNSIVMLCFSGSYLSDGGLTFFLSYAWSYGTIIKDERFIREYDNETK